MAQVKAASRRWMYGRKRPNRVAALLNRGTAALVAAGIGPKAHGPAGGPRASDRPAPCVPGPDRGARRTAASRGDARQGGELGP